MLKLLKLIILYVLKEKQSKYRKPGLMKNIYRERGLRKVLGLWIVELKKMFSVTDQRKRTQHRRCFIQQGIMGLENQEKILTLRPAYKRTSADVFRFAEKVSVCVQQVIEISLINNSVWENI